MAMPLTDESALRAQLGHDEHLIWSGQPRLGVRFGPGDLVMVPFSLMWGGFAIFWEWMALRSTAPWFFKLWGVPFVLVGLYLIVGRFFWDAYQRRRTYYGVTDQRVLIVNQGRRSKVKSLGLATLGEITLSTSNDGTGSLQFGSSPSGSMSWWAGAGWPGVQAGPTFESIPGAKRVEDMIRQAQRAMQGAAPR
jgi:hypothetical protein